MSTIKQKKLAKWALFITVLSWASVFVCIRFTLEAYTPGPLALFRYLVASVSMIPFFYYFKQATRPAWRNILFAMCLGILAFAVYGVLLNQGEKTITAGVASFIIGLNPIFVTLFACWLYHEKFNRYMQAGLFISFCGLCLILMGETHLGFDINILLLLIASMVVGSYALLQKPLLARMNAVEFTAYAIWGGTLSMFMFLPELGSQILQASFLQTSVVIYMGIVPSAIGYICWSYGFKHLPASQAINFLYALPFFCILIAFLFLHEIPPLISLGGGILAMLGAIVVNKYSIKH
jgi:drug/metabolite transporter (DMT)-like permease